MTSQTIGLFEAKTRLSELVAQAEQGGEIVITRHSKPVAKIVPFEAPAPIDLKRRREAVARMQEIGAAVAARGGPVTYVEIAEWIREGRR